MTASKFKRFAIPAALVVGGVTVGSFVSPIGLASADENDTESTDSTGSATADDDATDTRPGAEDDHRHGRRGPGFGARVEALEEVIGLSAEEIHEQLADGSTLADVAESQGVSSEELTAALVAAASEHIDQAVADGKLDAEEAEVRKAELEDRIADMITRVPPEDLGDGPGARGGPGRPGPGGLVPGGSEVLEDVLGLTGEEIREGLADGKTLADLAEEQGVSVDDVADALVAEATERIDQAVEDGKLDADRAAQAKENLEDMIDRAIEAEPFALGRQVGRAEGRNMGRHGHGEGGLGVPGHHGTADDTDPGASDSADTADAESGDLADTSL